MHPQSYTNTPGYIFLAIGLTLSLLSAFVPYYDAGYRLMASVFIAGILPYIIYGIAVPLLRSKIITIVGLLIVIAHTLLIVNERIFGVAVFDISMIYYGPMIIAALVLPFAVIALNNSLKY